MTVAPPSPAARVAAREHVDALAVPQGALGQLAELGVWLASVQDRVPPTPPKHVHAVVFAGDHGVAEHAVSAYPREITPMMVRAFVAGTAGVAVLARQHDVRLRVLDIAVDADLSDLGVDSYKVRRSSRPLHLGDALSAGELEQSLAAGRTVAAEEIAAGAELLISGDMGIGNTTPAAALIAAALGLPAEEVAGRGTGVDDEGLAHKIAVIDTALRRVGHVDDPHTLLAALGSADIAASAGFMAAAAESGVPVVVDGLIAVAAGLLADRLSPGASAWFVAGHRSTEPAQSLALDKLGLVPVLDLGLRLGEGSGAVAAVPLLRSAALLMNEVARLDEL